MRLSTTVLFALLPLAISRPCAAQSLKAGAAKVDVTPAASELPKNYEGILDHLYARAIVLDNGTTRRP